MGIFHVRQLLLAIPVLLAGVLAIYFAINPHKHDADEHQLVSAAKELPSPNSLDVGLEFLHKSTK